MNRSMEQLINETSQQLNIDQDLLKLWLDQYVHIPINTVFNLLHLAQKYSLDPLSDEVAITTHLDGSYQAYISIDGWSKLINEHPQFGGISLRESSELSEGIPNWIECTIYRHDRLIPVVIREYLEEVKTEHPSWQRMPRRMLRHRVIQQCARLAFGISASDLFESKPTLVQQKRNTDAAQEDNNEIKKKRTRSEILKEKLSV